MQGERGRELRGFYEALNFRGPSLIYLSRLVCTINIKHVDTVGNLVITVR